MKNLKKKQNAAQRGKRETKERIVLVATYKGDLLTKWRGWYNYPISDADKIGVDNAAVLATSAFDVTDCDIERQALPSWRIFEGLGATILRCHENERNVHPVNHAKNQCREIGSILRNNK